ncbi:MAG: RNA polymerase sigma factor [Myxococcota bacterium]
MSGRDAPDPAVLHRAFRYALALTHDRTQAEDLVHDAWIRVHGRRQAVEPAYLITTLRNLWIDLQRRRAVVPMVPLDHEVAGRPLTEAALVAHDEVGHALGTLPEAEREVLFLNVVEGWTAREIAELVGRPRNTVLTWLARARHRLATWRANHPDQEVL